MPKYGVKNYFAHGRFPEVGQKQKTEKKKKRKLVITMAMLCMAHISTHGARKPPGPIIDQLITDHYEYLNNSNTYKYNWPRRLACAMRARVHHA